MASCVKISKSEPITKNCKIVYKLHEDETSKMTYHYGYSVLRGKFCWHFGNEDTPEKNIVKVVFDKDTLDFDDKNFILSDSLRITYVNVYHDSIFHHRKIENVKIVNGWN
jgi:hypothetical protein